MELSYSTQADQDHTLNYRLALWRQWASVDIVYVWLNREFVSTAAADWEALTTLAEAAVISVTPISS